MKQKLPNAITQKKMLQVVGKILKHIITQLFKQQYIRKKDKKGVEYANS